MVLLSKQWDKAFLLIRSGGKYGRIGLSITAQHAGPQSPAKKIKESASAMASPRKAGGGWLGEGKPAKAKGIIGLLALSGGGMSSLTRGGSTGSVSVRGRGHRQSRAILPGTEKYFADLDRWAQKPESQIVHCPVWVSGASPQPGPRPRRPGQWLEA